MTVEQDELIIENDEMTVENDELTVEKERLKNWSILKLNDWLKDWTVFIDWLCGG